MRNDLLNQLEIKGISKSTIAKQINVSPALLTKFFTHNKEIDFETVLNLVKTVKPDQEQKLMGAYCMEVQSPSNLKAALEYLSTNRIFDKHQVILHSAKEHKNKSLNEWASIQELQIACQKNSKLRSEIEYLNRINELSPSDDASKALLKIMEGYHYYYIKEFRLAKKVFDFAYELISNLDESFVKRSLSGRCLQLLSYLELKINANKDKAIELANDLIDCDMGLTYNAYGYYVIGLASLFSDYKQALNHFNQANKIYKEGQHLTWINEVNKKIELLNLIHNPKSTNISELKSDDDALNYFLDGIKNNDSSLLYRSMIKYLKQGDSFLAQLPKQELINKGEDRTFLNELQFVNQIA